MIRRQSYADASLGRDAVVARGSATAAIWRRALIEQGEMLVDALTQIGTWKSATDELHRSIKALAGLECELARTAPAPVEQIAVFLPSNNVLYSYVLLAIVPSTYARRVVVRPSSRSKATVTKIHALLGSVAVPDGEIVVTDHCQSVFVDGYCAGSDAVVFTGRFENALAVSRHCRRDALFMAFGSGPNAIVIGPAADVERAVADVVRSRSHNSGQDCLCPDLVFVHDGVYERVIAALRAAIGRLKLGPRPNPQTDISGLTYEDAFRGATRFIDAHRGEIVLGGGRDHAEMLIEPTLIVSEFDGSEHAPELFSPVFNVRRYTSATRVRDWLCSPAQVDHGMYVSVYGERAFDERIIGSTNVLQQATAFDAENGNEPIGGYGVRANFVAAGGRIEARPLLLSAEIAAHGTRTKLP